MILSIGTVFFSSVSVFATDNKVLEQNDYTKSEDDKLSVFNTSTDGAVNTGDLFGPVGTIEEQLEGLSDAQKEVLLEKLNNIGSEDADMVPYATPTWHSLSGFTMYKQEESYFCTVACCKAAIQYLIGTSQDQYTIARGLHTTEYGTVFSNAQGYLNTILQSAKTYAGRGADTSLATMKNDFYSAIYSYDTPPLISVKMDKKDGWPYSLEAHTACISGARSDKQSFKIADPYMKWVNNDASMYYNMSANIIHTAIANRGNGYIF